MKMTTRKYADYKQRCLHRIFDFLKNLAHDQHARSVACDSCCCCFYA